MEQISREEMEYRDRVTESRMDCKEAFRVFMACPNFETQTDLAASERRYLEACRELALWLRINQ